MTIPYSPVPPTFFSSDKQNIINVSNHIEKLKSYNTEIFKLIAEKSDEKDMALNSCTTTEE